MFVNQFCTDILTLGVKPDGVLLVHSSLKSFGKIPGGAETIIRGLLATIGEAGTLLMPGFSYETVRSSNPIFDVAQTPVCVGLIPETFRNFPGVQRSIHPTHSVCGIGPLAGEILGNHHLDSTPCGPNSPFHLLPKYEGQILMLGCGLKPNTSLHAIEEIVEPPYLFATPYPLTIQTGGKPPYQKIYTPHNFSNTVQRYDRVSKIIANPALREGSVVNANSHLIEAKILWKMAVNTLKNDPFYFVDMQSNQ